MWNINHGIKWFIEFSRWLEVGGKDVAEISAAGIRKYIVVKSREIGINNLYLNENSG